MRSDRNIVVTDLIFAALSTAKAVIVQKIVSSVHRQAVTRQGRNVIHWYLPIRSWKVQKECKRALRFAVVTCGKRLSEEEIDRVCQSLSEVHKEVPIELCASFGLLEEKDFIKLKEAGVTRVHNNLESSRSYFEKMCSTHTYDEKIKTIKAAQKVGLSVCSGGLMGIGESNEDRVDMAMTLRELGITSVPVNMLSPIKGTPLGEQKCLTEDDMRRIVAVYRFILPKASIRLAGGRGLMEHYGMTCFTAGSNATITGTLLTTAGVTSKEDMETIKSLGYEPRLWND